MNRNKVNNLAACEASLQSYSTGFALSVLLTAIAFLLVMRGALPRRLVLIGIFGAAVLQILVYLHYFLHLNASSGRTLDRPGPAPDSADHGSLCGRHPLDHVPPELSFAVNMFATIKKYTLVTKPGIVCGNLIAATGGFLLASKGRPDLVLLTASTIGISLVVASGCVFNNWLDRDLDRTMARTRNRILARGLMSPKAAILYGLLLAIAGCTLLSVAANGLCVVMVLSGFAIYVGGYSLCLKRHSPYATAVGSLAGAAPALAGYCAAGNRFDLGALILLTIFIFWQMSHSHAIAIFRIDDYMAAALPVLPVKRGVPAARRHILFYIPAYMAATLLLSFCGYTGNTYLAAASFSGSIWLLMAGIGFKSSDERLWAKRIFIFSILSIIVLSVMMAYDTRIAPLTKNSGKQPSLAAVWR